MTNLNLYETKKLIKSLPIVIGITLEENVKTVENLLAGVGVIFETINYCKLNPSEVEKIRTEAKGENTSSQRLTAIYQDYLYKEIDLALTLNPNTPLNILWQLSQLGEDYRLNLFKNLNFLSLLIGNDLSSKTLLERRATVTLANSLGNGLKLHQIPDESILYLLSYCYNFLKVNTYVLSQNNLEIIICQNTKVWNQWKKDNCELDSDFFQDLKFTNCDLREVDFKNTNLKDINFNGVNLEKGNLEGANLKDAELKGANLKDTNLKDANLKKAKLDEVNLNGANLENADLEWANLNGANVKNTNVKFANLTNADLEGANLTDADLTDANLKFTNLRDVKLNENTLIGEKWKLVWDIVNHPQQGRDLRNADLEGGNLENAYLNGADLRGANLKNVKLNYADLRNIKLDEHTLISEKWRLVWYVVNHPQQGRDLQDKDLAWLDLKGVNFSNANLYNTFLRATNLREANLSNANLEKADLEGADLRNANLKGSNLKGVDLRSANLIGADLRDANFKNFLVIGTRSLD